MLSSHLPSSKIGGVIPLLPLCLHGIAMDNFNIIVGFVVVALWVCVWERDRQKIFFPHFQLKVLKMTVKQANLCSPSTYNQQTG